MVRRVQIETVAGGGQGMQQPQQPQQPQPQQHGHKHNKHHKHHKHKHPPGAPSLAPAEERLGLSLVERKESRSILSAYSDFWSQLRFRKGWAVAPFSKQDVLPMLEEAAALVALIRSDLDRQQPGFKMRMVDGSARELLHTVSASYTPQDHPDRFVVDLVHATVMDGAGYVEGLSSETVDAYIRRFSQGRLPPPDMPPGLPRGVVRRGGSTTTTPAPPPAPVEEQQGQEQQQEAAPLKPEEGAPLVRSSSVLGQEAEIEAGVLRGWEQLTAKGEEGPGEEGTLGRVMELVKSGWARGNPRRLLALRRLVLALHAVGDCAEEVLALASEEEGGTMEVVAGDGKAEAEEDMSVVGEGEGEQQQEQQWQEEEEAPETEAPAPPPTPAAAEAKGEAEAGAEAEEGRIEIERVKDETEALKAQIADLTKYVATLTSSSPSSEAAAAAAPVVAAPVAAAPAAGASVAEQERVLEELQGRCAKFVKGLMHGLNILDELHVAEADRPLRKTQVLQIQQLIDDCEQAQERLRALRAELQRKREAEQEAAAADQEAEAEEEEEEEEPEPEPEPQKQQQQQQQQQQARGGGGAVPSGGGILTPAQLRQLEAALAPHWRRMRMRPRLETGPQPHAYVIQALVPHMKMSDLAVSVGARGETLTLKGFRGPTPEELQQLAVLAARQHGGRMTLEGILIAGAERYGSFAETLRLPRDADVEGLEASYEKGVLRVIVPRLQLPPLQPVPVVGGGFPFGAGGGGLPHGGGGGRPAGFWGDQDLWW